MKPDKYKIAVQCKDYGKTLYKNQNHIDGWSGRCQDCHIKHKKQMDWARQQGRGKRGIV